MKQLKPIFYIAAVFITVSFLLPTLLVLPFSKEKHEGKLVEQIEEKEKPPAANEAEAVDVAVFRTKTNVIDKMPLEDYLVGVVGSEMPASFEMEALKAQAIASRTYALTHLLHSGQNNLPEGADVSDTVSYQVYKDQKELRAIWGKEYEANLKKVKEAIKATEGEVLTYNGKPFTAFFFSMSNGYTENAEDYWENQVPYLKSVESPWDSESPKFTAQTSMPINEFEKRLGVKLSDDDIGTITARTAGKKVATITIDNKQFTGREIREKLGLRSTDFSWVRKGDAIVITTKGYGHGVGMSQYGANGMAKEGKGYKDIVTHYYQNIAISNVDQIIDPKLAVNH